MEKYLNPALSPDERAKDLLGKMSLDEKMAQVCGMWLVPGHEDGMEKACEHGIGQVSTLWMREMETLDEVVGWQRKAQEMVLKNSEHGIRGVHPGFDQLPVGNRAWVVVESRIGREGGERGRSSGTGLRHHAGACPRAGHFP